jgi:4-alpha-glucanotransferase
MRIIFSKLCIELSVTKAKAENSLIVAGNALSLQIQDLKQKETTTFNEDATLKKLKNLHKNALRYFGIIAWKNHKLKLAIQRHTDLLTQYPNFIAAQKDHSQWIDLLNP